MQHQPWYAEGMWARFLFGLVFAGGYVALAYDLLTAGKAKDASAAEPVKAAAA